MAYVTFVLDQGLCVSASGLAAARSFMAKPGFDNRDGSVWDLASRELAFYSMGRRSRFAAGIASSVAAIRTPSGSYLFLTCHRNFRLGLFVRCDFPGMDSVPRQLAFASLEHAFLGVLGEVVFLSCVA